MGTTTGARTTFSCDLGDGGLFGNAITLQTGLVVGSVPNGSPWHAIAVGDLNGDGNLDIVETDSASGDAVVLFGNGDGTFQPGVHSQLPTNAATGDGPSYVSIAALGDPATRSVIFSDTSSGNLIVETVQPGGTLGVAATTPGLGAGIFSYSEVADLNCDGLPDLLSYSYDYRGSEYWEIEVLLGARDGTYQPAGGVPAVGSLESLGDFNEDGILDLLAEESYTTHAPVFAVFPGRGDGTFSDGGIQSAIPVTSGGDSWILGDLNEDGHLDAVVFSSTGIRLGGLGPSGKTIYVFVLLGHGDGTFSQVLDGGLPDAFPAALADLDGDGHLDYVGSDGMGALGKGDGSFRPLILVQPGDWSDLRVGDVNNDGRPDLIVSHSLDGNIDVFLNNCR